MYQRTGLRVPVRLRSSHRPRVAAIARQRTDLFARIAVACGASRPRRRDGHRRHVDVAAAELTDRRRRRRRAAARKRRLHGRRRRDDTAAAADHGLTAAAAAHRSSDGTTLS